MKAPEVVRQLGSRAVHEGAPVGILRRQRAGDCDALARTRGDLRQVEDEDGSHLADDQIRAVESPEPEARRVPSGEKATEYT